MNYAIGISKGFCAVLEERGINRKGMNADKMREILGSHPNFRNEKNRIERMLTEEYGHIAYTLPKYCKLNPIERIWAQAKRYLL